MLETATPRDTALALILAFIGTLDTMGDLTAEEAEEELDDMLGEFSPKALWGGYSVDHLVRIGQYEGLLDSSDPLTTLSEYATFLLDLYEYVQESDAVWIGSTIFDPESSTSHVYSPYSQHEKWFRASFRMYQEFCAESPADVASFIGTMIDRSLEENLDLKCLSLLNNVIKAACPWADPVADPIALGRDLYVTPVCPYLPPTVDSKDLLWVLYRKESLVVDSPKEIISYLISPEEVIVSRSQTMLEAFQTSTELGSRYLDDLGDSPEISGDCEGLGSSEDPTADRELKETALLHLVRQDIASFMKSFEALSRTVQSLRGI